MMNEDPFSQLAGARCLVTGGAGFIGSNLTRKLLESGARVQVLDNLVTGRRENLGADADGLELLERDLVSCGELPDLVRAADFVFHLAAQVGNLKSIEDPQVDARTNILGTVRLLDACRVARRAGRGPDKVVYSSSAAGYGEAQRLPIDEQHPQDPVSFYALSKWTAERYASLTVSLWRLPVVSLRYFNVFGLPMQENDYTGVISIFFRRLRAGEPLIIFGDGGQFRDFVFVDDVVQANIRAALFGPPGEVFNVGSGRPTTITVLAETMAALTDADIEIHHEGFRAGEVRQSLADIRRAREQLGYDPEFDLGTGLRRMWDAL